MPGTTIFTVEFRDLVRSEHVLYETDTFDDAARIAIFVVESRSFMLLSTGFRREPVTV